MTAGIHTLTEKEKETLRLLVSGYDAKSMARHLGLSVHTINERLRDARRKMAVSSSREAARQLHASEARSPEFLGDASLGAAATDDQMKLPSMPAEAPRMVRPLGWIAGVLIMSFTFALFALTSLTGAADPPAAQPSAAIAAETAPVRSARAWLDLVDRNEWNGSWDATGQAFKSLNTVQIWTAASEQARVPLGRMTSRVLINEEHVPAPPYGYQLVRFRTSYAHRADAVETLSLSLEGGEWRVVGYVID